MIVEIQGYRFPEHMAAILAAPVGVSTHAPGTWSAPCDHCGVACLLGLDNHLWRERAGTPVFCGPCAVRHHPNMVCGMVGDRFITLREAIDQGLVKI